MTKSKAIKAKLTNKPNGAVETSLDKQYNFRFNEVTGEVEFSDKNKNRFQQVTDYVINSYVRELRRKGIESNATQIRAILNSDFARKYNPIQEYFRDLSEWDREN